MLIVSRGTGNPYAAAHIAASNPDFSATQPLVQTSYAAVCSTGTPMEYLRDFNDFLKLCFESSVPVILILMIFGTVLLMQLP